jgi:chemotaxis protein MotB
MNARWKLWYAFVSLLATAVVVAGCGVSKSKYLSATQSADSLSAKNQELQSQLDQVNADLARQKQQAADAQATYDAMVAKLREEVNSGQVEIQKLRDGIRVNMPQDILFPSGSASLDAAGRSLLGKVSEELKSSSYEIVVIGHTDNVGVGAKLVDRYPTNWELGAARAGTIVRYFQEAGIPSARMLAVSAAENRPRADNASPEGRGQNRRIEIRMRPVESEGTAAK